MIVESARQRPNLTSVEGKPSLNIVQSSKADQARFTADGRYNLNKGPAIRSLVPQTPDGKTIFDNVPPSSDIANTMMTHLDQGEQQFTNYEYPAQLLGSQLIEVHKDGIGNRTWVSKAFLLGDHYQNGVGYMIPKEQTWNKQDNETQAYVNVTYSVWDNEVSATLLRTDTSEWQTARASERKYENDPEYREHVAKEGLVVYKYRQEQAAIARQQSKPETEELAPVAAD
jgi:hypothetical protein